MVGTTLDGGRSGIPEAEPGVGVPDPGGFEVGIVGLVLELLGALLSTLSRLPCICGEG